MKILILGAPGAGKGTQAKLIAEKYQLAHISTGDIFRSNIQGNTALGQQAQQYMSQGLLVPDELTIALVKDYLETNHFENGYILDGFPRTIPQAESFDAYLASKQECIDYVIDIEVPDEFILDRMSGRRVCTKCGATYHIVNSPSKKEGVCDTCGTALIQREDDQAETVQKRLEVYHAETQPLIDHYKGKAKYLPVDGTGSVEEVFASLNKMLGA